MKKLNVEDLHKKIAENSKIALYSSLSLSSHKASSGEVGIWWFIRGKVVSVRELVSNLSPDSFTCVEQEHCKVWPFVQKQYAEEIPEILEYKYNEIERGRVWWSSSEKKFYITCSKKVMENKDALYEIKKWFGIESKAVCVRNDPQYDVAQIKE